MTYTWGLKSFVPVILATGLIVASCEAPQSQSEPKLKKAETVTLERIYNSSDFDAEWFGVTRWLASQGATVTVTAISPD